MTTAPGEQTDAEGPFAGRLRRAGELVAAGRLPEAESEITGALETSPQDLRALKLLALVRFKLGRLAEAREVYRAALDVAPEDATVRLNLGLIALKLDWFEEAVTELEAATRLRPQDDRAWSYLGYAYARVGAHARAAEAFRRAGQHELAAEMDRAGAASSPAPSVAAPAAPGADALPPAGSVEIAPLSEFVVSRLLRVEDEPVSWAGAGVLRLHGGPDLHVRHSALLAARGPAQVASAGRRVRGRVTSDLLGSPGDPFVRCAGGAEVWICSPRGRAMVVLALDQDVLYLREDRVLGFEGELAWESGRVPWDDTPLLQFRGGGRVVLACGRDEVLALPVGEGAPLEVTGARLIGWIGRVVAHSVPLAEGERAPRIACEGEGVLLLSRHGEPAQPDHEPAQPDHDGEGAPHPGGAGLHR